MYPVAVVAQLKRRSVKYWRRGVQKEFKYQLYLLLKSTSAAVLGYFLTPSTLSLDCHTQPTGKMRETWEERLSGIHPFIFCGSL